MRGELVSLVLFDIGAELDLGRVTTFLGGTPERAFLVARRPSPRYPVYEAPLVVPVDPARFGAVPAGTKVEARLHAVGALSVRFRVPFDVPELAGLIGAERAWFAQAPEALAATLVAPVREEVAHALVDPYPVTVEPETYELLCLVHDHPGAEEVLGPQARTLSAVLQDEPRPEALAQATVQRDLRHVVRYGRDDALIVSWERALLVAPDGHYEDVLDIVELANLELLELRTYDAYIDRRTTGALTTLDRLWGPGGVFHSARRVLRELSDLRIESVRLTENLYDTRKIFGDWYLAKVHQSLSDAFHLQEWQEVVDRKMDTLKEVFSVAGEEAASRRAVILEAMIVLLFIVDLALIFFLAGH